MLLKQISTSGSIIFGSNPSNFSPKDICDFIFRTLNTNNYEFKWIQQSTQPYRGLLDDGTNQIDLYIYAWNITPAYRKNPSEKRIQLPNSVDDIGILRPITSTEKTIIIGLYNSPTGTPLIAAWDTTANRYHRQKSCYIQIEDVAQALTDGIFVTRDKNGIPIFTMTPEFLGDYISLLGENNNLRGTSGGGSLKQKVFTATTPAKKKRTIHSVGELQKLITNLSLTEQETIQKSRIGQGYFRELLINKYGCKCMLCGIETVSMLRASHIKSWASSTDSEKLDENNGLLLCAHHDALFDKHLISFEDTGAPIISPTLSASERTALQTAAIPHIHVPRKMKPYLAVHRSLLKK